MNTKQLLFKFNQGINWNAILSISHRILSIVVSYSLYCVCTAQDYNLWANTQSIIFIMVLWIDGGLRKSVPRFAPVFAAHQVTKAFIKYLTLFQGIALILTVPFLIKAFATLSTTLGNPYNLMSQVIILFFLEGIISYIRLIYHSYFWHKSFNERYLLLLTAETIIACICILWGVDPLVPIIISLKIMTGLILILLTAPKIPAIINDPAYRNIPVDHTENIKSQFMMHTAAMWGSNTIKSLSERNVTLLVLTYIFGPGLANIYKIANDGAVVIYRTLIKTIGTTDTSLLAHSQIIGEGEVGLQKAFKKVSTKVVGLCLPLLGLIGGVYSVASWYQYDHIVFYIIFIVVIGYILEVAFSSYERVLEVNFRYRYLIYAYVPYIILLISPFLIPLLLSISLSSTITRITCIGLPTLLIAIRCVRLVSTLLMVYFARRLYDLTFPISLRTCIYRILIFYIVGLPIGLVLMPVLRRIPTPGPSLSIRGLSV